MTRRSLPRRALSGVFALALFVYGPANAAGLRPCPHHDGSHGPAQHGHATHHDHAAHHEDTGANEHGDAGHDPAEPCTCASDCQLPTQPYGPPAPDVGITLDVPLGESAEDGDPSPAPRLRPAYSLPLAHAPPGALPLHP